MREHHGRGRSVLALALGSILVLGACRTDRELTEPEPIPVTEEGLRATLITTDDVPSGFTPVEGGGTPISAEVVAEHDCDQPLTQLSPAESVSADFTRDGVTLSSTAAWFPGQGGAVEQVYRDVASRCAQVVVADQNMAIRTGGLDFGVLSDNALAMRFEIEPTTGPITERDLIVVRRGDLVHLIRLSGPRPSDKGLLDGVVRIAIGRTGRLHSETT